MSFIQMVIKCDGCGKEMNIILGTFGFGMPEKCPDCGTTSFQKISDNWDIPKIEMKDYKSHYCCWEQEQPPACGLKGEHSRCCLCENKKPPEGDSLL